MSDDWNTTTDENDRKKEVADPQSSFKLSYKLDFAVLLKRLGNNLAGLHSETYGYARQKNDAGSPTSSISFVSIPCLKDISCARFLYHHHR